MTLYGTCDDGAKGDMRTAELLGRYGVDCTFYIPVRWQMVNEQKGREALTEAEFKDLASRFTIGSHTINHPLLTRIEHELAVYEIRKSRELLQEMTGQSIDSFCYPRGYYSYQLKQAVEAAGYTDARTVQVGHLTPPEDPYLTHTTVHVGCDRKEYGGLDWLSYARKKLDEATEDSVFTFMMHSWEVDENNQWERFEDFLKMVTA